MFDLSWIFPSKGVSGFPTFGILVHPGVTFGNAFPNVPIDVFWLTFLLVILFILFFTRNSNQWVECFSPNWKTMLAFVFLNSSSLLFLNRARAFLYFDF
jgi:hypothetical protein